MNDGVYFRKVRFASVLVASTFYGESYLCGIWPELILEMVTMALAITLIPYSFKLPGWVRVRGALCGKSIAPKFLSSPFSRAVASCVRVRIKS
jgi:hypothetical protein